MSDPPAVSTERPHVLREYALLADGRRGVLVGPRGDFAWMCFPSWESDAVFASLVGGGGSYAVTPEGRHVWGGFYEHGLVWCSRWVTETAIVECREALAMPSSSTRAVILRQIHVRRGAVRMHVQLDPRAGFGACPFERLERGDDGVWSGRTGELELRWAGAAQAQPVPAPDQSASGGGGEALVMTLDLGEGDRHDLVLAIAQSEAGEPPTAEAAWRQTEAWWREQLPAFELAAGSRDARHAYAVMLGLTGEGGGMVAATTMGLPERAGAGRSYDYRYVWIRDQCYAGQAVARAGGHALLDCAVRFVGTRLLDDGAQLMPAYTVDGGRVPDQRELDLPGYPGGKAIAGNWVNQQFQLDAFGEALLLFAAAARHDRLDGDGHRAALAAAAAIEARWREPDAGVWELDPDEWTHSRLICAAGLRAAAPLAPGQLGQRWESLAETIVSDTAARALHRDGRWKRAAGDERLDAALLLAGLRGAIPSDDPRTLATLRAIEATLTEDGYCYRFRPDERPLGEAEGAFLLCGFWLALALHQQGDAVGAARWFERNRAACGPPGLLSEEFDVSQRQLRGNLPQAFVHALLLECAATLGGGA